MNKFGFLLAVFLIAQGVAGCEPASVQPQSGDSQTSWAVVPGGVPVDPAVYSVKGEVIAGVKNLVRQTDPASGSSVVVNGTGSGSYTGPTYSGKSFVRILVLASDTKLAVPGTKVILKVEDSKALALLPGDVVQFKCRIQFEAITPVMYLQVMDKEKDGVWELDLCRFSTPLIQEGQ